MDSFVFNSFKERLIVGDADFQDTWYMYPVNKQFSEVYGDFAQYVRDTEDFIRYDSRDNVTPNFSQWYTEFATHMTRISYTYTSMYDTDVATEPEFVTKATWEQFSDHDTQKHLYKFFFENDSTLKRYNFYRPSTITVNGEVLPRGFYYVRTIEELKWCANKVNGQAYDNTINIVFGDNIGSKSKKKITFSIGSNPAQPYEGILFGNGFIITNIELHCTNTSTGIIGNLGPNGMIIGLDVFAGEANDIDYSASIVCDMPLNITHLASNGSDIVAGIVCGKNNGKIFDIRILGSVKFNGFVPAMYSVDNKSDNLAAGNCTMNIYYPDYLCYNSMGNIIPYIGYFNEGVFATYSGFSKVDNRVHKFWNLNNFANGYIGKPDDTSPIIWNYWVGAVGDGGYVIPYTAPANRKNVLWYDSTIVSETYKLTNPDAISVGQIGSARYGLLPLPPTSAEFWDAQSFKYAEYAHYFDKSIKMCQQNRAAYYVSPLIGMNNGMVENVFISADCQTSGTFVGFMGGLAGKQSMGDIINCNIEMTASDMSDDSGYVRDLLINNANANANAPVYRFPKKSIKNIGGLFGSCAVGNSNSLHITDTNVNLRNKHNIVVYDGEPAEFDYYLMNRFGTIAAMVEYNSCNISDMWYYNNAIFGEPSTPRLDDVNDAVNGWRSIYVTNSNFAYTEAEDELSNEDMETYRLFDYVHENMDGSNMRASNYMFGNMSTLFGEIKPYYLSVPSIISTPFHNTTAFYDEMDTLFTSNSGRVGLFTVDQNFAAPASDMNFWSINAEVDLPGVANSPMNDPVSNYKLEQFAGGVIDRINCPSAANFSLDVCSIASKLVRWNNTRCETDCDGMLLFGSVAVPAMAQLANPICIENSRRIEITAGNAGIDSTIPDGASAEYGGFNGNKALSLYPYFGSDLYIQPTTGTAGTDVATNWSKIEIVYNQIPYYLNDIGEQANDVHFKTGEVKISIMAEALKYAPFNTAEITLDKINEYYSVLVRCMDNVKGAGDDSGISTDGKWTSACEWSEDKKGVENGKCSELLRLFDGDEDTQANVKNWLDTSARGARYGWYFYNGYDETSQRTYYYNTFIPFDMAAYAVSNISGLFPPNSPFMIGNIVGSKRTDSQYRGGTQRFGHYEPRAKGNLCIKPFMSQIKNVTIYPKYFNKNANGITVTLNTPPELTSGTMFGYVAGTDPSDNTYKFIKSSNDDEYTLDPAEAKTQRVTASNVIGVVTASDDNTYNIYPTSLFDTYALYSAYSNYNDGTTGNYQEFLTYTVMDSTEEDEEVINFSYVYSADAIKWPTPTADLIRNLNISGKFTNALMQSTEDTSQDISISLGEGDYTWNNESNDGYTEKDKAVDYAPLSGFNYMPTWITSRYTDVSGNHSDAVDIITQDEHRATYFKYSYVKSYDSDRIIYNGIPVPVEFAYANSRAGFWCQGSNLDGNTMYNDDFRYSGCILNIGQTYNEECILKEIERNGVCYASGFSADDFDGLYVVDGKKRPVMYIDTGMGKCEDCTSWSYTCYPNMTNGDIDLVSGLLLEVNADV